MSDFVSDKQMAEANITLEKAIEELGKTAHAIRNERDQALYVIDTLIANMARQLKALPLSEGNAEAGAFATEIAHWLDYARDQREQLR